MRGARKFKEGHGPAFVGLLTLCAALFFGCGAAPSRTEVPAAEEAPSSIHVGDGAPEVSADLLEAALDGHTERVGVALDRRADANAPGVDGRTALMLAAFGGHTETVRVLLDRGARVGDSDPAGRTSLMYAASGPNHQTVQVLLEHGADPLTADDEEQFTALMFAAAEGQAEVVRVLLGHGSDPGMVDVDGDTALDFAVRNHHTDVAALLRRRGQSK